MAEDILYKEIKKVIPFYWHKIGHKDEYYFAVCVFMLFYS